MSKQRKYDHGMTGMTSWGTPALRALVISCLELPELPRVEMLSEMSENSACKQHLLRYAVEIAMICHAAWIRIRRSPVFSRLLSSPKIRTPRALQQCRPRFPVSFRDAMTP